MRIRRLRLLAVLCAASALLCARAWNARAGEVTLLECTGDFDGDRVVSAEEVALTLRAVFDPTLLDGGEVEDPPFGAADLFAAYGNSFSGCDAVPLISPSGIYRAYPGFEIALPIEAESPGRTVLSFRSPGLPLGADLGQSTGILSWIPAADQLGPYYLPFVVAGGLPPRESSGELTLKVSPLDACIDPSCDPAAGCVPVQKPIDTNCCGPEPEVRVAEPLVPGCPEGRVMFIGRNTFGFGRLQDCDRIRLFAASQAGVTVRLHVEARCITELQAVSLYAHMETRLGGVHTDYRRDIVLRSRDDGTGFVERVQITLPVFNATPELEGEEAILTMVITDPVLEVEVSEQIRVVLTHKTLADLPDL